MQRGLAMHAGRSAAVRTGQVRTRILVGSCYMPAVRRRQRRQSRSAVRYSLAALRPQIEVDRGPRRPSSSFVARLNCPTSVGFHRRIEFILATGCLTALATAVSNLDQHCEPGQKKCVAAMHSGGDSRMPTTRTGGSKRGFAAMDPAKQREIASKGGKASHGGGRKAASSR